MKVNAIAASAGPQNTYEPPTTHMITRGSEKVKPRSAGFTART